ncbi:MAG: ATP-binding protein [Burkholderiaceae bacterium]
MVFNGQRVFHDGSMVEPVARHCHYPRLVMLPAGLWQTEGNQLDVRVAGQAAQRTAGRQRGAGLSALVVGPSTQLAPIYSLQRFVNITLGQFLAVLLAALGTFMIVLGRVNRRERYISHFGWLSLGWALLSARVWLVWSPLPARAVEIGFATGLAALTALTVLFFVSYAGRPGRRWAPALILQCAAVPTSLWLLGPALLQRGADLWSAVFVIEVGIAAGDYLLRARTAQPRDFWPMSALLGYAALLLSMEALARIAGFGPGAAQWLHWGLPLLFLAIGIRLLQVFARALHSAETARQTLEARVREVTAEIERNFAQVAELRVEQVTEKERKRIAGDLHDDLGAKLLTIVHTSESERISSLAREALEEMRLSVRGLTGKPMRLADALADWRAETVMRLGQAGIEADWRSPLEEMDHLLPARGYVQTTRILRESVSNIIKHSGASHCKVRCAISDRQFGLTVQDNGRGIATELEGKLDRGHGMTSMKHRAKQMQGQCLVESGPGYGTVIRLTLPL